MRNGITFSSPFASSIGLAVTLKDVLNSKKPIKMGAVPGGTMEDLPNILNLTLGTKFDVIAGYRGTAPVRIAMQRREIDKKFLCLVELFIGLAFLVGASATALGEEFYKGKSIRFVVGASPGGGYDTYTRTIARNIGKYIPGNPTPIVQNMTGAGMLIAAHYIYKRAKEKFNQA